MRWITTAEVCPVDGCYSLWWLVIQNQASTVTGGTTDIVTQPYNHCNNYFEIKPETDLKILFVT